MINIGPALLGFEELSMGTKSNHTYALYLLYSFTKTCMITKITREPKLQECGQTIRMMDLVPNCMPLLGTADSGMNTVHYYPYPPRVPFTRYTYRSRAYGCPFFGPYIYLYSYYHVFTETD